MPFAKILRKLVGDLPGATGAILTDWEGEAVVCQSPAGEEYNLKILGAHQNIILNRLREMGSAMDQAVRDVTVTTDRFHLLIGAVGNDYMLVVTLDRAAIVTRALHGIKQAVRDLEKEIY